MTDRDAPQSNDDAVGAVVEWFLARVRNGERPALTDLVARYPELGEQLQEIIPALVELEQLGSSAVSSAGARTARDGASAVAHPPRLGDYHILRRIGGGGMGEVYEAEHESLKSRVALKVMHPRFRTDHKYLRRFHIEARSAAGLHHTNIVSVFDYGEQDGICYYAMQYINGQPLDCVLADLRRLRADGLGPISPVTPALRGDPAPATAPVPQSVAHGLLTGRFADAVPPAVLAETRTIATSLTDTPDSTADRTREGLAGPTEAPTSSLGGAGEGRYFREVARICAQVADALDYAHRAGVLHRDIKPPNLLLDALGNVWVTDFGLAKLEQGESVSQSQELVGTLRYMAPERLSGTSDRKGDVYALGATLYELLTLQPAFDGADQVRLIDRIVHEAPVRPRELDRRVPLDLETIVLKALAKDPKDRFGTAGELAEELRKFIAGHPIRSRPISPVERFWRWCKRDPRLAGANVAAAVLTTVLALGSLYAATVYRRQVKALEQERGRTRQAALDARERAVEAYIAQADAGRFSHRQGQRFKSLEALTEATRLLDSLGHGPDQTKRRETLRDLAIAALALPDLRVAWTFGTCSEQTRNIDVDPALEQYVVSDHVGNCALYQVATGAERFRFPNLGPTDECWPLLGPQGRRLALRYRNRRLQLWRIDGPKPSLIREEPAGRVVPGTAGFRGDGSALMFVTPDGELVLIDTVSGGTRVLPTGSGKITHAVFHPDGRRLVVLSQRAAKTEAQVRGLDDPSPTASLDFATAMSDVTWFPDGRRVALAGLDSRIYLWEPNRPTARPMVLSGLNNRGLYLAINRPGDLLASQGWEGMLRLWDPHTGRQLLSVPTGAVAHFSADDRYGGIDRDGKSFQALEVASGRELRVLPGDPSPDRLPACLTFEPSGRLLAARTQAGVQIWDTENVELLADLVDLGWSATLFENDGSLLTFGTPGLIRWPLRREAERVEMGPPRLVLGDRAQGGNIASSRDGKVLLLACPGRSPTVLSDEPDGRLRALSHQQDVRWGAISPDGRWAATVSFHGPDSGVVIWEARTGRRVTALKAGNGSILRFSPDGRWLATSQDLCKLWEVGTWRLVRVFGVECGNLAFSPVDSTLAVCTRTQVLLYDPATGRRLATLEGSNPGNAVDPTFSPDGARLAMSDSQSHEILIWDLRLIRSELAAMGLDYESPGPAMPAPSAPLTSPPTPIRLHVNGADKHALVRLQARNAQP